MGNISREGFIVLIILGCIVSVLIGYSIHFLATGGFKNDKQEREMSIDQKQYMRALRQRNLDWIARDARTEYNTRA
ncbi:uncharacterized protein ATNIH1004_008407 [Aspergillus tanneri]|uniref:Uncharacterized protein n=1 Tax=Aspergillus tanneri TaxID=1220188 RepID=A0A5M9MBB7_9EURO|nr:uncharacterized protein ATNIH1004_008407 [Aspergillus tanneri]KAA8644208.1 hypothetical protein ATNIH1004_008407 [Aspergillus tanneri]